MDSEFRLNVPGWYETQGVTKTNFDPDQYGNEWYSVKFVGDAGTHLWLAKEAPESGKSYYGHFELTKSGKKMRFKRDQVPEDAPKPGGAPAPQKSGYQKSPEERDGIFRCNALTNAAVLVADAREGVDRAATTLAVAEKFYAWLKKQPETVSGPDIEWVPSEEELNSLAQRG